MAAEVDQSKDSESLSSSFRSSMITSNVFSYANDTAVDDYVLMPSKRPGVPRASPNLSFQKQDQVHGKVAWAEKEHQDEDDDENVEDSDEEVSPSRKKGWLDGQDDSKVKPIVLSCMKQRNPELYSFSKNVDFARITNGQKRRFLGKSKTLTQTSQKIIKGSNEEDFGSKCAEEINQSAVGVVINPKYMHESQPSFPVASRPSFGATAETINQSIKQPEPQSSQTPSFEHLSRKSSSISLSLSKTLIKKQKASSKENDVPSDKKKTMKPRFKCSSKSRENNQVYDPENHRSILEQYGTAPALKSSASITVLGAQKSTKAANDMNLARPKRFSMNTQSSAGKQLPPRNEKNKNSATRGSSKKVCNEVGRKVSKTRKANSGGKNLSPWNVPKSDQKENPIQTNIQVLNMNFQQPNMPNANPFETLNNQYFVKSKPVAFEEDEDLVTKQASDEKSQILSDKMKTGQKQAIWNQSYIEEIENQYTCINETPKQKGIGGAKGQKGLKLEVKQKSFPAQNLEKQLNESKISSLKINVQPSVQSMESLLGSLTNKNLQHSEVVTPSSAYYVRDLTSQKSKCAIQNNTLSQKRASHLSKINKTNHLKKTSVLSGSHINQSAIYTTADLTFPSNENFEEFTLLEDRSSYTKSEPRDKSPADDFNDEELAVPGEQSPIAAAPAGTGLSSEEITQFKPSREQTMQNTATPKQKNIRSMVSSNIKKLEEQYYTVKEAATVKEEQTQEASIEETQSSPNFAKEAADEEVKNIVQGGGEEEIRNEEEKVKEQKVEEEEINEVVINFESLCQQQELLMQLRDLLELRPSMVENYVIQKSELAKTHAIEGLNIEERTQVQNLCQDWWDLTQEEDSFYQMALDYQQQVQESFFKGSYLSTDLAQKEKEVLFTQNIERSNCIRRCVVLQSAVIGLTAFFSMLLRPNDNKDFSQNHELELRSRLSQLFKILYDQFILCQSQAIGKFSNHDLSVNQPTWDNKLYQCYMEHIHLLYINKKIQSEEDYFIFNIKQQIADKDYHEIVINDENRDYQLNQLSKRLEQNTIEVIQWELQSQLDGNNEGNVKLLNKVLDVVLNSSQTDFQEAKNIIYEGISESEAMPQSIEDCDSIKITEEREVSEEQLLNDQTPEKYKHQLQLQIDGKNDNMDHAAYGSFENGIPYTEGKVQLEHETYHDLKAQQLPQKFELIKNFRHDENQVIIEESREETSLNFDSCSFVIQDQSVATINGDCSLLIKRKANNHSIETTSIDQTRWISKQNSLKELTAPGASGANSKLQTPVRREPLQILEECNNKNPLDDSNSQNSLNCSEEIAYSVIQQYHQKKNAFLPERSNKYKYTLVLDLDETLIHCNFINQNPQKSETQIKFMQRPGLYEFMQKMHELFEIVIFTAGNKEYADGIIDSVKWKDFVSHRLYWEHISLDEKENANSESDKLTFSEQSEGGPQGVAEKEPKYYKDLSKLGRPVESIIIVDNIAFNFCLQPNNGICIKEWKGEANDTALPELQVFLRELVEKSEDGDLASGLQPMLQALAM